MGDIHEEEKDGPEKVCIKESHKKIGISWTKGLNEVGLHEETDKEGDRRTKEEDNDKCTTENEIRSNERGVLPHYCHNKRPVHS